MSVVDLRGARLVPGTSVSGESFLDEWLTLRGRLPLSDATPAVELSRFLGMIAATATRLTPRDRELMRAIEEAGSVYRAARDLSPGNPESMEARMRHRARQFREISLFFLRNAQIPSIQSLERPVRDKAL